MGIVFLCMFERNGRTVEMSCIGMLPVALYAPLYSFKIFRASKGKRWDDFYGFNRSGKWPVSYLLMHLGAAAICIVLYFLLNV